jgi:hypothetical protein
VDKPQTQPIKEKPEIEPRQQNHSAAVQLTLLDLWGMPIEEPVKKKKTAKKGNTTKHGRLTQTGDRVLITSGDGMVGYINAKNRFKLEQEIDLPEGENPLLSLIPYFANKQAAKPVTEQEQPAEQPAQTLIEEGK